MFSSLAMASLSARSGVARPVSILVTRDSVHPTRCARISCVQPKRRRASRIAWPVLLFVFIFSSSPSASANGSYTVEKVQSGLGGKQKNARKYGRFRVIEQFNSCSISNRFHLVLRAGNHLRSRRRYHRRIVPAHPSAHLVFSWRFAGLSRMSACPVTGRQRLGVV